MSTKLDPDYSAGILVLSFFTGCAGGALAIICNSPHPVAWGVVSGFLAVVGLLIAVARS